MSAEPTHRRGDLWLVDLGAEATPPEQAFVRPALVVSDDLLHHPALDLLVVIPGTTRLRSLPLHVVAEPDDANGLERRTAFQVEQVRAVAKRRLIERLGRLDAETRHTIDEILRNVLSLTV